MWKWRLAMKIASHRAKKGGQKSSEMEPRPQHHSKNRQDQERYGKTTSTNSSKLTKLKSQKESN